MPYFIDIQLIEYQTTSLPERELGSNDQPLLVHTARCPVALVIDAVTEIGTLADQDAIAGGKILARSTPVHPACLPNSATRSPRRWIFIFRSPAGVTLNEVLTR